MKTKETKIEQGSGNVLKDLGHPDADAHLLKTALVTRITKDVFPTGPRPDR